LCPDAAMRHAAAPYGTSKDVDAESSAANMTIMSRAEALRKADGNRVLRPPRQASAPATEAQVLGFRGTSALFKVG